MDYTIKRYDGSILCTIEQVDEFDDALGWHVSVVVHVDGREDILFTDYYGAMTYVAHLMEVD